MQTSENKPLSIAIIGTGISGLSAAWLLSKHHLVTVFEKAPRLGGHTNTVEIGSPDGPIPIDTGFIVYGTVNYPNLTELFQHLDVATKSSNMGFAVSLGDGAFEYAGNSVASLFAQKRNLFRPRFWSMLSGILRFYRQAPGDLAAIDNPDLTLGEYLNREGFGAAFQRDHLLPMAGAIWSAPPDVLLDYPAASFIRFFDNHSLLKLKDRPLWRTVVGGSKTYVAKLTAGCDGRVRLNCAAVAVTRDSGGVEIRDSTGHVSRFDHVVVASHADEALALLADPSPQETKLLGAFRYSRNHAVLHSDATLMPKRRAAWSSWNYLESSSNTDDGLCVTYWMNALQGIGGDRQYFVTLNPMRAPLAGSVHHSDIYDHPIYDSRALRAQAELSTLQGARNTWFCGAYFGAGFHEDGLKSGLEAAEALGGVARPWHRGASTSAPTSESSSRPPVEAELVP